MVKLDEKSMLIIPGHSKAIFSKKIDAFCLMIKCKNTFLGKIRGENESTRMVTIDFSSNFTRRKIVLKKFGNSS